MLILRVRLDAGRFYPAHRLVCLGITFNALQDAQKKIGVCVEVPLRFRERLRREMRVEIPY